jgi:hypothetical protein
MLRNMFFYEVREFLVVGRNCKEVCFWILFFSRDKNEKRMFNVFLLIGYSRKVNISFSCFI